MKGKQPLFVFALKVNEVKRIIQKRNKAKRKIRKQNTKQKDKYRSETKRKEKYRSETTRKENYRSEKKSTEAKRCEKKNFGSEKIDAKYLLKYAKPKRNESHFASFRFEAKKNLKRNRRTLITQPPPPQAIQAMVPVMEVSGKLN
jgi:hypothetical protein